ncbi:hypothetical protein Tco_0597505 [Tanacetum coccineum]
MSPCPKPAVSCRTQSTAAPPFYSTRLTPNPPPSPTAPPPPPTPPLRPRSEQEDDKIVARVTQPYAEDASPIAQSPDYVPSRSTRHIRMRRRMRSMIGTLRLEEEMSITRWDVDIDEE